MRAVRGAESPSDEAGKDDWPLAEPSQTGENREQKINTMQVRNKKRSCERSVCVYPLSGRRGYEACDRTANVESGSWCDGECHESSPAASSSGIVKDMGDSGGYSPSATASN